VCDSKGSKELISGNAGVDREVFELDRVVVICTSIRDDVSPDLVADSDKEGTAPSALQ